MHFFNSKKNLLIVCALSGPQNVCDWFYLDMVTHEVLVYFHVARSPVSYYTIPTTTGRLFAPDSLLELDPGSRSHNQMIQSVKANGPPAE